MKMRFLIIIIFLYVPNVKADIPWSANVKVSTTPFSNEGTLAVKFPFIYAAYNGSPAKFCRSTDGGITWLPEHIFGGTSGDPSMYVDELGNIHITILKVDMQPGQVRYYRSIDNGITWSTPININSGNMFVDKNWTFVTGNRIYVGWASFSAANPVQWRMMFSKSTNRGLSFSPQLQVNDGNAFTYRQWALPFEDPKDSNTIYFSMTVDRRNFDTNYTAPWQVFVGKSTDGGVSWMPNVALPDTGRLVRIRPAPRPYAFGTCMAVSPVYNDVYVIWQDRLLSPIGKHNVFFSKSSDGGVSFLPRIKIPTQPDPDTSYHFQPWVVCDVYGTIHLLWYDTRGFAANDSTGIKGEYYTYSTDRGVTWAIEERVSDTTDSFSGFIGHYLAATTDSHRVYALWTDLRNGGASHLFFSWRPLPYKQIIVQNIQEKAETFYLSQNYPNPFNPLTQIKFGISKTEFATLKIYDVSGRHLSTPINETLNPGTYKINFDGGTFSSGIYFYALFIDGLIIDTKKMVILK